MRSALRFIGAATIVAASISCGDVVRTGRAPVYLIINSLEAARGSAPGQFTSGLVSDVIFNRTSPAPCTTDAPCPTVFGDPGRAVLSIALKDIGPAGNPTAPSTNNSVTITHYRVVYRRADGRNTPGIDVPYPFDGATTATVVGTGATTVGYQLVRVVAKQESPLVQLIFNNVVITALADVTFYGHDQVGNEVSITGTIQVDFGNFGDITT